VFARDHLIKKNNIPSSIDEIDPTNEIDEIDLTNKIDDVYVMNNSKSFKKDDIVYHAKRFGKSWLSREILKNINSHPIGLVISPDCYNNSFGSYFLKSK